MLLCGINFGCSVGAVLVSVVVHMDVLFETRILLWCLVFQCFMFPDCFAILGCTLYD